MLNFDTDPEIFWQDYGNCLGVNPDLFFPEVANQADIKAAKIVCAGCVVREACLDFALKQEQASDEKYHAEGREAIWGGTTIEERKILRSDLL